jgi:hypothetical protein
MAKVVLVLLFAITLCIGVIARPPTSQIIEKSGPNAFEIAKALDVSPVFQIHRFVFFFFFLV